MTTPIQTTGTNRNRLVLVGAVGIVILLAAIVLPRTLFGGDGGDDELGAPPDASGSSASPTTTTTAPSELTAVPSPEAFSTKNPFAPLVDSAPAATAGTGTTDGTSTTGEATDVPDPAATGTGGTGTGTSDPAAAGSFSLIDVYVGPDGAAVATVEVDGQMYTVSEGETFAGGYRVVSLSVENKSGVFTSPSDGGSFTPSAGESVLK